MEEHNTLLEEHNKIKKELKIKKTSEERLVNLDHLKELNIEYPPFQRAIINERVDELYKKMETRANFITPIILARFNKKHYLLDGQHRYAALTRFKKFDNIKIKIIHCKTQSDIENNFRLINDTLTLPEIYKSNETIIKDVFRYFQKNYKSFFTSKKARKPIFNVNDFQTKLSDGIRDKNVTTGKQLIDMIECLNNKYAKTYEKQNAKEIKGLANILSKRRRNIPCLFLRLNDNWIDDLNKNDINRSKLIIPKKIREFVWDVNYYKEENVKCICCDKNIISKDNFEAGHIISESDGGKINKYNLHPICHKCNISMNVKPMFQYMHEKKININLANHMEMMVTKYPQLYKEINNTN